MELKRGDEMNEKINGLWDKAVTLVEQEPDGDWSLDTIKDKFAELIIQECIDYCGENLSKTVGGALKIHFGVKE
jgi:hypothetical protein